uniref:molybdopterin adenylyltransferase n=1 Tax=Ditylenchus dipsaci TaxID=166011 RepID=A0A915D1E6_9BILA
MTDAKVMNLEAAVAPVILRSRKSDWPAVPMVEALSVVEQAFKQVLPSLQHVRKDVAVENVQLGDVLAEDILAKSPYPPFRASIKDGYAVLASDGAGPRKVVGASTADKNTNLIKVYPGVCCRINTGAAVPDGSDAVIQVEDTTLLEHNNIEETMIMIVKEPRIGQDIREIGSDVALGELLLEAGIPLQPADMGLLALSNSSEVNVYQAAKVAVLSTGDELTDQLIEGETKAIRDTNRPVLLSLFKSIGAQVHDIGIARDSKCAIVAAIQKLLK